ncbi:MAG: hypothetical protein QXD59_08345, partial [Candidatus Caldarchaeum sp.]
MAIPPPPPGSEQAHLLEYCDLLVQEGRAAKGRVDKRWEQNLQFVRGKQWSGKRPSYYSDLVVNVVGSSIRKKVSLLTDTKPVISVVPVAVVSEGGADLVAVAELLTKLARAWWDRCGIADALAWMVYNAQIFGCAFANIFYNPALDNGLGDIDFEPWDPRRVLLDPMVVRSARLDDASWIVLEQVKEIGELVYRFGDKAKGVAADSRYSRFSLTQPLGGVDSPVISGERPMVLGDWTDSVTPRVVVQEFWIRDWRRMRDIPTPSQRYVNEMLRSRGEPERGPDDLVFPRGRHVIRAG